MRSPLIVVVLFLVAATLACAGRVFETSHVYALTPIPAQEAYDASTDAVVADNAWVFRPDGTFAANLSACGTRTHLSGTYSGDDVGPDTFLILLDTNKDGTSDDQVQLDVHNIAYSFLEWDCAGQTLRFGLLH